MSVLHRNDRAKNFKQPVTLRGLKNNSDVVFTESDREKKQRGHGKKGQLSNQEQRREQPAQNSS